MDRASHDMSLSEGLSARVRQLKGDCIPVTGRERHVFRCGLWQFGFTAPKNINGRSCS